MTKKTPNISYTSKFTGMTKLIEFAPRTIGVISLLMIGALSGCAQQGQNYINSGIGSQLYTKDLKIASIAKDQYFGFICNQAGLPTVTGEDGFPRCLSEQSNATYWTTAVLQGLNDIDRRCDSYLAWLENQKRSRQPIIEQINATRNLTQAVLSFSNVAKLTIDITAQAFGYIQSSVTNYNNRLILAIDDSTINSIVLNRRNKYREGTKDYRYSNRPAAEHAIRAYLRICLPMTIETEINELSTLAAQEVTNPSDKTIFTLPPESMGTKKLRLDSGNKDFETLRVFDTSDERAAFIVRCGLKAKLTLGQIRVAVLSGNTSAARKNRRKIVQCLRDEGRL